MHQKIILLMEDEPVIALHLKCFLESKGYLVLQAAATSDALKLLNKYLPDFAILNIHYDISQNGMFFSRLMRTHFLVRILFITGVRQKDIFRLKSFYSGHTIICKPFTQLQLKTTLNTFLSLNENEGRAFRDQCS